jgi:hypothetical protein
MIYWLVAVTVVAVILEELGQASERRKRDR